MNPRIRSWLNAQKPHMYRFLEELVCIQSGSANKKGVDRVCSRVREEMQALGFDCQTLFQPERGNHLVAKSFANRPNGAPGKPRVLISGHMDTVFPADTDFIAYREDETRCFGPGTADMKGGLVVGIYALKALSHEGLLQDQPVTFVFNSDEEIGSISSRDLILHEARQSAVAFVLEAGGLSHEIVTGRKGNLSAVISVEGLAGHAAFAGKNKANALLELAHITIAVEALNDPEKGISANVGKIEGGIGPNTVARNARAHVDFRFSSNDDRTFLLDRFNRIISRPTIPRTRSSWAIASQRPVMHQNRANREWFQTIKAIGSRLNIPVTAELRPGVSDANIIALAGIPVIDGLGPLGARDHSHDEYILKQSLFDRTLLFAHILAHGA